MSDYHAPLQDIQFLLQDLINLPKLCEFPVYREVSADVVQAILTQANQLASEVLAPLNRIGDQQGVSFSERAVQEVPGFKAAYQQFVEGGWNSITAGVDYGGMGLPEVVGTACSEMWSAANSSFALCPLLTQGAIGALDCHGSGALRSRYLEKMISGEWTGTMNLTEPQAGSDLSAIRCRAEPEGDRYRLFGSKIFITWGDHQMTDNIVHLVLARLPDAPAGMKGVSLFLVPKFLLDDEGNVTARNDVYPSAIEKKMGIHASPTCVMSYGDTQPVEGKLGAVGYLVGEAHQGVAHMFTMMNHARLRVGVQGVALADRAYQQAVSYCRERVQGVPPGEQQPTAIIRHPDIRRTLLLMRSLVEASRAVNFLAAAVYDTVQASPEDVQRQAALARVEWLTPIAKGWATEIAQEVTSLGVQCHGGMGFIEETGAAQHMRDARITSIYEGTTAIQANDLIGRKLTRDKGEEIQRVIAEMRVTEAELEVAGEDLAVIYTAFAEAVDHLEVLADWVLANYRDNPRLQGMASYNFLMLAGTVTGGWLMAQSALLSQQKFSATGGDIYRLKLISANCYAEQVLPRSASYAAAAKSGTKTIMAIKDEDF